MNQNEYEIKMEAFIKKYAPSFLPKFKARKESLYHQAKESNLKVKAERTRKIKLRKETVREYLERMYSIS